MILGNKPKANQLQVNVFFIMVNSLTRFVKYTLYYGKHTRPFCKFFNHIP
jgi:hypothetical protein